MTAKTTVLPESDLVIFALNLSVDRHITSFGLLRCARFQYLCRYCFQAFPLFERRLLIDVVKREVPVSERSHHRLAFRALRHVSNGEAVEFHFPVIASLNEEHLPAAAGHLGRFGIEPAWTRCITRAGLFELARNFPWSFIFWFINRTRSRGETEKRDDERAERGEEKRPGFHSAKFYNDARLGQPDFVLSVGLGFVLGTAGDEARTRDVLLGKEVLYH